MRIMLLSASLIFSLCCQAAGITLTLKGTPFDVELAVSESEHRHGLMGKRELKRDQGMLFVYEEPQLLTFWMKDTLIPLDILFFNGDGELTELFAAIPPCRAEPCSTYSNTIPSLYVLELPAGTARALQLKQGDRFTTGTAKR